MTYDDLLVRLRDTLLGPHGEAAVARLRSRYSVVLIDEFQDTDPVQWEIVSRAFDAGAVALVLIADPKQAIYAFRGADVHAYLAAARSAAARATLQTNRRSDQTLVDALDALFAGARLGHPEIAYRTVRATAAHQRPAPARRAPRGRAGDPRRRPLTAVGHADRGRLRLQPRRPVSMSPRISRPTSSRCSEPRPHRAPRQRRRERRRRAGRPRRRCRAGAVPPQRQAGPERAVAGRASRPWSTAPAACSRPPRPRLAEPAGRAGAAGLAATRAGSCADAVARVGRGSGSHAPVRTSSRSSTGSCTRWARCCARRGVAALAEAITPASRCRRGCCVSAAANAG